MRWYICSLVLVVVMLLSLTTMCLAKEPATNKDVETTICMPVQPLESACYLVEILGTQRAETYTESQLNILQGQLAVIQCGSADSDTPRTWIALCIGGSDGAADLKDVPDNLRSQLRHVQSGELEAWYYLPDCDQLEITWATAGNRDQETLGTASGEQTSAACSGRIGIAL